MSLAVEVSLASSTDLACFSMPGDGRKTPGEYESGEVLSFTRSDRKSGGSMEFSVGGE